MRRYPRGRTRPGRMNKTEAAYAQHLELLKKAGEIQLYDYERIKIRLADKTFYTPDFFVLSKSGDMELHEVKGYMEDDAAVKIKVAAEVFPARFVLIRKLPKRDGGGWDIREV